MMERQKLLRPESLRYFNIRGGQGHRLESLSDGVFALAIAILLIASSVPKNFDELLSFVYDAIPLFTCMVFIYWIWYEQALFFMRYGLYDTRTIRLNLVLMFLTLFYAYPLKFLMSWLMQFFFYFMGAAVFANEAFWGNIRELSQVVAFENLSWLMVIYGAGFFSIFWVLYLLHSHALKRSELLQLSPIELMETRFSMRVKRVIITVTGISIVIALIGVIFNLEFASFFAGLVYNLLWVFSIPLSKRHKRELQTLLEKLETGKMYET